MHSSRSALQNNLVAVSLALMLAVLWMLMRGYQGFAGDAQIYAFQALARIHPALSADLYLQNTSQDQYTVFSPFYAWFIGWIGLENAARLLTLCFHGLAICGGMEVGRGLDAERGRERANAAAWLGAVFLVITAGDFGAAGVFRISDSFLTARLPAEALVVTALAATPRNEAIAAGPVAAVALFVHPLMAFPGFLMLICLWLPPRLSLIGAIAGVLAALGIALAATALPAAGDVLTVMDADWLEVVQERSQFLFLQLWSLHDWDINLRPFLYLIFIAGDGRGTHAPILHRRLDRRRLRTITLSLIGCLMGPVAVVVQGQAWRWEWIACFLSILLLPATCCASPGTRPADPSAQYC